MCVCVCVCVCVYVRMERICLCRGCLGASLVWRAGVLCMVGVSLLLVRLLESDSSLQPSNLTCLSA